MDDQTEKATLTGLLALGATLAALLYAVGEARTQESKRSKKCAAEHMAKKRRSTPSSAGSNAPFDSDAGAENSYAFRTASLRNLEFTAPYMHNGVCTTLEDILDFYDHGDSRRGDDRHVNVGTNNSTRGCDDSGAPTTMTKICLYFSVR